MSSPAIRVLERENELHITAPTAPIAHLNELGDAVWARSSLSINWTVAEAHIGQCRDGVSAPARSALFVVLRPGIEAFWADMIQRRLESVWPNAAGPMPDLLVVDGAPLQEKVRAVCSPVPPPPRGWNPDIVRRPERETPEAERGKGIGGIFANLRRWVFLLALIVIAYRMFFDVVKWIRRH